MEINKKDMISLNIEIGEKGEFHNESSLDFALGIIKQKKSWLYELSYLARSMLADRAFSEGNKRTALALILVYLDYEGIECDKQKMVEMVHKISKKSIDDINKIARLIRNGAIH
ncbi:hypothetical protein COV19_00445 [Candidatus Woesearchaeota archaeon CG10_big_fil_rev_8_21_14_0_10_44_13]|nr:MAG: hypothetical protein COV19_00445 [Candidatus Woesearchaeota archaeon CG10_big_fil_rev_8_21_14_0_10_44_13]